MRNAYEDGKAALDRLITWHEDQGHGKDRNEAATRFHLIDELLTMVLGWPRVDISPEDARGREYVDYALGRPAVRLIVEAKREGRQFSVPIGMTALVHKISSLIDGPGGRELKEAMEQAVRYCGNRGVGMAAVTNGTQIVAFLGVRTDGVSPTDGSALVFPSLSAMRENFRTLWDNLSRPGVEARTLYTTLSQGEAERVPSPLSANLPDYHRHKRRNDIQTGLQLLAELFLEDVTRDPALQDEFLTEAYANSGALSEYAMVSRKILESRYSLLHEPFVDVEAEPVNTRKGINTKLTGDVLASAISKRPIILLGDVGVGKTMFINRLIHVDARDVFERSISLYIDFGSRGGLSGNLGTFVVEEAELQLREKYDIDVLDRNFVEAVHHAELNRFERGIFGDLKEIDPRGYRLKRIEHLQRLTEDRDSHLRASLEHIRGSHGRQVIIFLDNIDQHAYEYQEQVFLLSETLAANWPVTVFVSLRPDTFYRSRKQGALTAYQPRAFTISPPRVQAVLKKRLDFALDQLKTGSRLSSFPKDVTIDSDSLIAYLELLRDNIESNDRLVGLVDNLSAGNIRLALQFISRFIGSGHVNTRKILGIYEQEGRYWVPPHEFLRAIIYGDYEYFDPDVSPIANLFQISEPDGREHFLLGLLIAYVEATGSKQGDEGFVPIDSVYAFAQTAGYSEDQLAHALDRADEGGLIERVPRLSKGHSQAQVRVTSKGVYTARVLVGMFTYLDAMVVDTPILDDGYRKLITNVHDLSDRLRRAEVFKLYLDHQWSRVEGSVEFSPFNWREYSSKAAEDIRAIEIRHARD